MLKLFITVILVTLALYEYFSYNICGVLSFMNPKMTTKYYKILEALYDNQLQIGRERYCPLGQDEIALIVSCNRMTVNAALKDLKSEGYVISAKNKHYSLTDKGKDTVLKAKGID